MANNAVVDFSRKKTRQYDYLSRKNKEPEPVSINNMDIQMDVKQAIDELPDDIKTVFLLSRMDGLKYKEIARICGISVKTVESRMTKAFKVFREKFR
jgi:RNA polymerase sigma-70 factor (ECF subfamily)